MARTKEAVRRAHQDSQERAAAATRFKKKKIGLAKAARIMTVEEVAVAEHQTKVSLRVFFWHALSAFRAQLTPTCIFVLPVCWPQIAKQGHVPAPQQLIKLSGRSTAGTILWHGRLRSGDECALQSTWVRNNFKAAFLKSVLAARGDFVHIPIGSAQDRPPPADMGDHPDGPQVLSAPGASAEAILTAERPVIAYRQGGEDLCAAYGLASAMHEYGDASGAAAIAACARAARASGDAFGHVTSAVRSEAAGWSSEPIRGHDPLLTIINEPVHLQLVGSDGAGSHAVATLGSLIFDSAEARALPLSRASLDRCVGVHVNGARFSHVARAVRLAPGKSLRKRLRREAQAA